MSTPETPKAGWQPTVSTSAGALLGGAVAQLICALAADFLHHDLTAASITSVTTIAVFVCGYLFPDGGRK